jgi:hypothetical protein
LKSPHEDTDEPFGFYNDDGTKINPELIPKPSLCVCCQKDDDPEEEILCILNRADQEGEKEFLCYAFEPKRI